MGGLPTTRMEQRLTMTTKIPEPSRQSIIQEVRRVVGSKHGRPQLYKDLPCNIEIETKININSLATIRQIVFIIKKLGVLGYEERLEKHQIYSTGGDNSICIISVDGQEDLWIKEKKETEIIMSPIHKIPIVVRIGNKSTYKPHEARPDRFAPEGIGNPITFSKHCINLFFPFAGNVYSLSFSLAQTKSGLIHQQMELEYEGSTEERYLRKTGDSIVDFEKMIKINFPSFIGLFNANTKARHFVEMGKFDETVAK